MLTADEPGMMNGVNITFLERGRRNVYAVLTEFSGNVQRC